MYSGIRLIVHNQTESPFTMDDGITIQPGLKTYVGITRQFTNKLTYPYSNCLSDLTINKNNSFSKILFLYFIKLNVSYYNQRFCYKLCNQHKLIKKCGCADIKTPTINETMFCQTDVEIKCLKNFHKIFTASDINIFCEGACPYQCNTVEYNLKVSTAGFPALNYLKLLQSSDHEYSLMFPQNVTDVGLKDFARDGFLKLIVNYDNAYYTTIDESPLMDSTSLFGFLGGQLGESIGYISNLNVFFCIYFI